MISNVTELGMTIMKELAEYLYLFGGTTLIIFMVVVAVGATRDYTRGRGCFEQCQPRKRKTKRVK